jgi:hypothetical protein
MAWRWQPHLPRHVIGRKHLLCLYSNCISSGRKRASNSERISTTVFHCSARSHGGRKAVKQRYSTFGALVCTFRPLPEPLVGDQEAWSKSACHEASEDPHVCDMKHLPKCNDPDTRIGQRLFFGPFGAIHIYALVDKSEILSAEIGTAVDQETALSPFSGVSPYLGMYGKVFCPFFLSFCLFYRPRRQNQGGKSARQNQGGKQRRMPI